SPSGALPTAASRRKGSVSGSTPSTTRSTPPAGRASTAASSPTGMSLLKPGKVGYFDSSGVTALQRREPWRVPMRRLLPVLVLLSLAFAPAPLPKGPAADLEKMQGVWVVESFIGNGVRMPATQENVWTIAGSRVTTTFAGMPSTRFT